MKSRKETKSLILKEFAGSVLHFERFANVMSKQSEAHVFDVKYRKFSSKARKIVLDHVNRFVS